MKAQGLEAHKNLLFPKYVYDERIKVRVEAAPQPPASIYQAVGYDKEVPEDPEAGMKHYRRFFDDELENVAEIFPKRPFLTVDVLRGQTRGLSKGWFSFFLKQKTDESGQASSQKVVGQFKGRISVENARDKEAYTRRKQALMKSVYDVLGQIHQKRFNEPLGFKPADLDSFEQALAFEHKLEQMGVVNRAVIGFLRSQ